jgi:hypothetical protein
MNNREAIDRFMIDFPEYLPALDELLSWWSPRDANSGLYTFFGQIIDPLVFRPMLVAGPIDPDVASRFFEYLEELLDRGDQWVRECVKDEIVEQLVSDPEWYEKVCPFAGERLRRIYFVAKQS